MKKIYTVVILLFLVTVSYSQKKFPLQFFYYDFSHKTLYKDSGMNNKEPRPIKYRSGNDLQIEIKKFNPLKDQISFNDSSITRFLDTSYINKLSGLIVFPNVSNLSPTSGKADSTTISTVTGRPAKPGDKNSQPVLTSCGKIKIQMQLFDNAKQAISNSIKEYQTYITKIEFINDDYNYLKSLNILTPSDVVDRLSNSFVFEVNDYIISLGNTSKEEITPSDVSSRQLSKIEQKLYNNIKDASKEVDFINTIVNALTDDKCDGFIDLYKQFSNNYNVYKTQLNSLDSNHTNSILPAFKKNTDLFDQLKIYMNEQPYLVTYSITIEKDKHIVTIKSKSPQSTDVPAFYDYINVEPVRGWKLDVAGGFFLSGLSDKQFSLNSKDSLYSKQYLVNGEKRDTTVQQTFYSISEQKQVAISFGGMLYLHAHTQNSGFFNYGIALGFGALFNDQARWTGSIGPTFLIGKTQRFNINPGLFISQVRRLSAPYETDKWYDQTINNIPTYMAWKFSWGIGFSWNIK